MILYTYVWHTTRVLNKHLFIIFAFITDNNNNINNDNNNNDKTDEVEVPVVWEVQFIKMIECIKKWYDKMKASTVATKHVH